MKKILEVFKKFDKRTILLTGVLIIVTLAMYSLNPQKFATINNLKSIAVQFAEYGCLQRHILSFTFAALQFCLHYDGNILSTIVLTLIYNNANLAAAMSPGMLLAVSVLAALLTGMACSACRFYLQI